MTTPTPGPHHEVIIVGAGATGLAAAGEFERAGRPATVFEAADRIGGNAGRVMAGGAWFETGLTVPHPHFERFRHLLQSVPTLEVERRALARLGGHFIDAPVQVNLHQLPDDDLRAHLVSTPPDPTADLDGIDLGAALDARMGRHLAAAFGRPHNFKMFAAAPETLASGFVRQRAGSSQENVPTLGDSAPVRRETYCCPIDGTQSLIDALAAPVPDERIMCNRRVSAVALDGHRIDFDDGSSVTYDHLVTTMPLPLLLGAVDDAELRALGTQFPVTSTSIVGLVVGGAPCPTDATWAAIPDLDILCHRISFPANILSSNCADGTWSLLCEANSSTVRPVTSSDDDLLRRVVDDVGRLGLLPAGSHLVDSVVVRLAYGYPPPFLGRDELLGVVDASLTAHDVFTRGRLGGYRYETSNLDYAIEQGCEIADRILHGTPETTWMLQP